MANLSSFSNVVDNEAVIPGVGGHSGKYLSTDGSTMSWSAIVQGVTTYDSIDALPLTGVDSGTLAYVESSTRIYFWNGSGWYSLALINTNPSITTGADDAYQLAVDGTATVITLEASDPEGLPLTWSYSVTSGSIGNTATVSQSANVFTITPSTNEADVGEFSLTFTASDGINTATSTAAFTLTFVTAVENSNYTSALITGAAASQNQSITDSSSNAHTVTVNGDASSQTFSPYRSGGYSYCFDGSSGWLVCPGSSDFGYGTGNFTIEFWAYLNSHKNYNELFDQRTSTQNAYAATVILYTDSSGNIHFLHSGSNRITATMPVREWVHIALSRSGTSTKMFLNGVQAGSTYSDSTNYVTPASNWSIGGSKEQNNYSMDGYISDLRVVKGTAVYTADFTPPTERLEAITNTSLLTCHLPYVKDGSSNDHSITVNGDVSPEPFGPYDYSEYNPATHGGSVYFDGTGDYLSGTLGTAIGTNDFTIEFWVYISGDSGNNPRVFTLGGHSNGGGLNLLWTGTGFRFDLPSNTTNFGTATGASKGRWYHIALTRNSGTAYFFVNGIQIASASNSTNLNATAFNIAADNIGLSGYDIDGYIADFRIVIGTAVYTADFTPPTEPLTAIAGTELLISGTDAGVVDKSQRNQLTLTGNTTGSTTQTKYGTSMYFDYGDYLTLPDSESLNMGTADFTVEFWYRHASTWGMYPSIISGKSWTGGGVGIRYDNNNQSNKFAFFWHGIGDPWLSSSTTFSETAWHHVALTRSGTTFTLWVNGTSQATGTNSGSIDWAFGGDCKVGWGEWDGNDGRLNAYIEDLRITKGLARYTSSFTPPTASLEG